MAISFTLRIRFSLMLLAGGPERAPPRRLLLSEKAYAAAARRTINPTQWTSRAIGRDAPQRTSLTAFSACWEAGARLGDPRRGALASHPAACAVMFVRGGASRQFARDVHCVGLMVRRAAAA